MIGGTETTWLTIICAERCHRYWSRPEEIIEDDAMKTVIVNNQSDSVQEERIGVVNNFEENIEYYK